MEHTQLHHTKLKKDKTRTLCKVERNLFQMENTFDIFCFFLREQYLKQVGSWEEICQFCVNMRNFPTLGSKTKTEHCENVAEV